MSKVKKIQIYKFKPILKQVIWGGDFLANLKGVHSDFPIGESWELSPLAKNMSIVANGEDAGLSLKDIIQKYKESLVGNKCYSMFGDNFPLLFKLIDAQEDLSIQVHPSSNELSKNEMWYVMNTSGESEIIAGFDTKISKSILLDSIENNSISPLLKQYKTNVGDVYYIPAGLVHAIKKGSLIAEIQQASDTTYRLFDYNRVSRDGEKRELHIQQALGVIDFDIMSNSKIEYSQSNNTTIPLVDTPHFVTALINLTETNVFDYTKLDSFVVYMCVQGECEVLDSQSNRITISYGETVMMSAQTSVVKITPKDGKCSLLEVHI